MCWYIAEYEAQWLLDFLLINGRGVQLRYALKFTNHNITRYKIIFRLATFLQTELGINVH